ncbi:MAG: glycosyl hydrolase [Flavobacteriales bacterium]
MKKNTNTRCAYTKRLMCSISLFLIIISNGATAQSDYENVLIDKQLNAFEYPPCEPSICISPNDPSKIVAGAILKQVYVSADSGKTWAEQNLQSKLGVYGDPCVIANNAGDFYYFHLGDPSGMGWGNDGFLECIVSHRSTEHGANWTGGSAIGRNAPKDQDKEWAVATHDSKKIFCTWTQFDKYESTTPTDSSNIMFSCTNRKAKKWKRSKRINQLAGNCADNDSTVEGAVPAAGPDGEIYVAWALNETIYFDRSTDGGKHWLEQDIAAAHIPGGWAQDIGGIMRCNGMPVLVCDNSNGPNRGTLYICWSDTTNSAADVDIWISSSKDKGNTWSKAVRVNDDAAGKQQFLPWLAIDQTNGNLYIVFYDRRNHEGNMTDVYLASSTDGGLNWLNERISHKPFTPQSDVFFGDYNNISAHNGVVRPIWTRLENGQLSVWTALISK